MSLGGKMKMEKITNDRFNLKGFIHERLKIIRKTLGLSQSEFAKQLGKTLKTIQRWESGQYNIPESALRLISRTFNISLKWLTEGEGEMFLPKESVEDLVALPVIYIPGKSLQGAFRELINIYTSGYEFIQKSKLPNIKAKAFKVGEDGMEPTIREGEMVIIDEEDRELVDGGVYLFVDSEKNGLIVRRLRNLNGEWWLFADNPTYPPERLKESVIVLGRVKYKFKPAEVELVR